jgi:hypothetical protein
VLVDGEVSEQFRGGRRVAVALVFGRDPVAHLRAAVGRPEAHQSGPPDGLAAGVDQEVVAVGAHQEVEEAVVPDVSEPRFQSVGILRALPVDRPSDPRVVPAALDERDVLGLDRVEGDSVALQEDGTRHAPSLDRS